MIDIQDVHKQFTAQSGGSLFKRGAKRIVHAVQGVSLAAANGRITGLLGANGAGKTTTLRMLAGLLPPDGVPAWVLAAFGVRPVRQPTAGRRGLFHLSTVAPNGA